MTHSIPWLATISTLTFVSVYALMRYGSEPARRLLGHQERMYDRVLRQQLLIDIKPRTALWLTLSGIVAAGLVGLAISGSSIVALFCAAIAVAIPTLVLRHLQQKRRVKLEEQLVDGLTTIASGTRAGLNLVQSIELVATNHHGPIQQEFAQLLREYQMGLDLNQAMRNTSNRIGSPLYRLAFTAMEMHRLRGGDSAQSMDRIAESVREISRLEGKLDALTSQGRFQAFGMAVMPFVFFVMLYAIDPQGITMVFIEPMGRVLLLIVVVMIAVAFIWIRKIMSIEI